MGRTAMRTIGRLKELNIRREKRPGLYGDGGGLYLQVTSASSKSWIFRYRVSEREAATGELVRDAAGKPRGRTREMGLGSFDIVTLGEARERALECRRFRERGVDPLEAREEAKCQAALDKAKALTFRQCAEAYIASHRAGWRSAKHAAQWAATLSTYAYPVIGDLPVQTIDVALAMRVLEPLWEAKTETASRVRGRIEAVLDWATTRRYRQGDNPARWRGHLENLLPARSKVSKIEHHAALPYAEMPAFMMALRAQEGVATRALEFAILTAARTGETLGARREEMDLAGKLWTISGFRMKAGKDHRVPLSKRAMAIVTERLNEDGTFVFPGSRGADALGHRALLRVLERMGRGDVTAHGFRSTFRDWAAERTRSPNHVVEMALAHQIGSAVEAAYRRGDLLEQRRQLMDAWSTYCSSSPATGQVIRLNASRATTSA